MDERAGPIASSPLPGDSAFRPRMLRRLAVVLFVAGVVVLFAGGGYDSLRAPAGVRGWITGGGGGPAAALVLSMWIIQPFGVPGAVWMIPAGLVWPWPTAVALCWVGNMGSSTIAFAFARWVGRGWVAARIPPRIRSLDRWLEGRNFTAVAAIRLVTGQLPPADWLLGLSGVRWGPFLAGTAIGILPQMLAFVIVGAGLVGWLMEVVS